MKAARSLQSFARRRIHIIPQDASHTFLRPTTTFIPFATRHYASSSSSSSSSPLSSSNKEFISSATTYYDLFPKSFPDGPPPKGPFGIDSRSLRSEFLRLQAATHPDLAGASAKAEAASARLNH